MTIINYWKFLAWKYVHCFIWNYLKPKKGKVSRGESLIRAWLHYSNLNFVSQFKIHTPCLGTKTNNAYVDFMVTLDNGKRVVIEYNGRQHYHYNPFFHTNGIEDFQKQRHRDEVVKQFCLDHEIQFVEIPYTLSIDQIIDLLKETFNS